MVYTTATAQWNIDSNCSRNWWCISVPVWTILIIMRSRASIALDWLSRLRFLWALICLVWSTTLIALDWWSRSCVIHIPSFGINWRCLVYWDMLITLNNIMTEVTHVFVILMRSDRLFSIGLGDPWIGLYPTLGHFFHHHSVYWRNSRWRWLRS